LFGLLLGLWVGGCCGFLFWSDWRSDVRALAESPGNRWVVETVSDPSQTPFGLSGEGILHETPRSALVACNWSGSVTPPEAGEVAVSFGRAKAPPLNDRGRRSHREGVVGSLSIRYAEPARPSRSLRGLVAPLRVRFSQSIAAVPGSGGDLLAGVLLGDRRRLDDTPLDEDFRTTGLTHLVAVSGGHLVVVAAVVSAALALLRVRRGASSGIVVLVLGAYVLLSGVQTSAVRAWLMAAVLACVGVTGRRGDGLGALSAAVAVAVALWPPTAFDLGFRLSVGAVAGLLVFGRLAEDWLRSGLPAMLGGLASVIGLTLVAQAATLPLTVPTFGVVSTVSPLANLLVSPLVSIQLSLGLLGLAASLVGHGTGSLIHRCAGAVGGFAGWVASVLARLPNAAVPVTAGAEPAAVVGFGALVCTWVVWPRADTGRARRLIVVGLVAAAVFIAGPPQRGGPELMVLDVGQGDAILLRDGPEALLVDTGPSEAALRAALSRHRVRGLSAVLISHLHEDHDGGIGALSRVVPFERAYVAKGCGGSETATALAGAGGLVGEVRAGDRLEVGGWRVSVLWPADSVEDGAENESSVVLLAQWGGFRALLTGDAEGEVLDRLLAERLLTDVDVIKVGHHASAGAVTEQALSALKPEQAAVSVGAGNRFGHPVASTLEMIRRGGAAVHRTDRQGDIAYVIGAKGYTVRTQEAQ
jgi:competence protein ComEC